MTSTFQGLETARRGMFTQQSALYTLGHNVANANTPGYSRQRVNMMTETPYPSVGLNRPDIPGQMGTGVKTGSVQRVREGFLDVQYRNENTKFGYWEAKSTSLSKIENIMNELNNTGLAKSMDDFWQSLQDLAVNATNTGAKAVVKERGSALADTFKFMDTSLKTVRADFKNELDVSVTKINDLIDSIDDLNKQIAAVEPHGYLPNDLYDRRDVLIDELSTYANIKVEYVKSGGKPDPQAMGKATVKMVTDNSDVSVLVGTDQVNHIKLDFGGPEGTVNQLTIGNQVMNAADFKTQGKLKSIMESYGYVDASGNPVGELPHMLEELDNLAYTYAVKFNEIHMAGVSPNEIAAWEEAKKTNPDAKLEDFNQQIAFFVDAKMGEAPTSKQGFASRMAVSGAIKDSLDNIATSSLENGTVGDASNILKLAKVRDEKFDYKGGSTTEKASFHSYFQKVIGEMGVQTQQAERLAGNSEILLSSVNNQRSSVSSVSLDEEMTNMIQFQQAYNASARMITMIDECLDRIINGLGVGGR